MIFYKSILDNDLYYKNAWQIVFTIKIYFTIKIHWAMIFYNQNTVSNDFNYKNALDNDFLQQK